MQGSASFPPLHAPVEKIGHRLQPGLEQDFIARRQGDGLNQASRHFHENQLGPRPRSRPIRRHGRVSGQLDKIGRIVGAKDGFLFRQGAYHRLDFAQSVGAGGRDQLVDPSLQRDGPAAAHELEFDRDFELRPGCRAPAWSAELMVPLRSQARPPERRPGPRPSRAARGRKRPILPPRGGPGGYRGRIPCASTSF